MKKTSRYAAIVLCISMLASLLLFFTACAKLTYEGAALAAGKVGVDYSQSIAASGADQITYALKAGSTLPDGLAISGSDVKGMPLRKTDGEVKFTVVATAGDKTAEAEFSITIGSGSIAYFGEELFAPHNKESTLTVATATGTGDSATYEITSGKLPIGLLLNPDGNITGKATVFGEKEEFTVKASSTDCTPASATFSVEVVYAEALEFAGATITEGQVDVVYGYQLKVSTEFAEDIIVTFSLKAGSSLPEGLVMSENGYISGTPTTFGTNFAFTVIASAPGYRSTEAKFLMDIKRAPIIENNGEIQGFATKTLPTANAYAAYSATGGNSVAMRLSQASNGAPVTYSLKDAAQLPDGFDLKPNGDLICESKLKRTDIKEYTFTVVASANLCASVEADFKLNVLKPVPAASKWIDLKTATVGETYSDSVAIARPHADDGAIDVNFTYKIKENTSDLSYFTLSSAGVLSGTPTRSVKIFTYTIIVSSELYVDATIEATILVRDAVTAISNGVFEAEYVDLAEFQGAGDSSNPSGEGVIQSAADEKTTGVSNGYFVGYTHKLEQKLTFTFNSSQTVASASLTLRLASERGDLTINSGSLIIKVNNSAALSYNQFTVSGTKVGDSNFSAFTDYTISASIALRSGENTIEIIIGALTGGGGNLLGAPAFDCIKIGNTGGAQLSWVPCKYNLDSFAN